MLYNRINDSIETKVIGRRFPQVERVIIPTQWDAPEFIESYLFKMAPSDVLLPTPVLYKSSKVTDLISSSTVGLSHSLLISNRLKKLLEGNKLYGIQFFSVKVHHKEKEYSYWILHPYDFYYKQMDFEKSFIGYYQGLTPKNLLKRIIPKNDLEFENEIKAYDKNCASANYDAKNLQIGVLEFKESYSVDFFCIRLTLGGVGFFVSEKLKNEIENAGCTGMVFTSPNDVYP